MEQLIRDAVSSRGRPARSQNGLPDVVASDAESLEGLDRPMSVVVEHGVGSRARRPADRPYFLATVPQQLERLTA
eukprot:4903015-Alexandrium_andersonii.AAC.1